MDVVLSALVKRGGGRNYGLFKHVHTQKKLSFAQNRNAVRTPHRNRDGEIEEIKLNSKL